METSLKKLPKGLVEITIDLNPEEMQPYLKKAAQILSEQNPLPGFRPGKAPLNLVIQQFGENYLWETAAEEAVQKTFVDFVKENHLETIGSPKIDVLKLAPQNNFVFKATVALLPEVEIGNLSNICVPYPETTIGEKEVAKVLEDLQKMQTQEIPSDQPLTATGKVVVDMEISQNNVPLEGGQTKDHAIYMTEDYYIPNLKEKLLGIKKGETREFYLTFPKDHYQKNLAGKESLFKVTAKEVFELKPPELNDQFAQSLGQKTLKDLENLIKRNLEEEAKIKNEEKYELAILDQAIQNCRFSDIPEILINEEVIKMIRELKESLAQQGIDFETYLQNIKKTIDDLKLDFVEGALKRIKVAIFLRKLAEREKIEVSEEELNEEIARVLKLYENDPETQKSIRSPEAKNWLHIYLRNKKTIAWLKARCSNYGKKN